MLADITIRRATLEDADGVVEGLHFAIEKHRFIGSCYINGEGKDVDILILVDKEGSDFDEVSYSLKENDWSVSADGTYPSDSGWFAARRGLVNLLITSDDEFYWAMGKGADICKNLREAGIIAAYDKRARVIIHRTLTGERL